MFLLSDIKSDVLSALGAEGVDFYRDAEDLIPATNKAINWMYLLIDRNREINKRTNEAFKHLRETRIYQTSALSYFDTGNDVFTIDAIIVKPDCYPDNDIADIDGTFTHREDLSYSKGGRPCSRSTSEQLAIAQDNPFVRGNAFQTCGTGEDMHDKDFISYTYTDAMTHDFGLASDYMGVDEKRPIKIFPLIPNSLVAVTLVISHPVIETVGDYIRFPSYLKAIITQKITQFISYQEGQTYDIMKITEDDLKTLTSLFL